MNKRCGKWGVRNAGQSLVGKEECGQSAWIGSFIKPITLWRRSIFYLLLMVIYWANRCWMSRLMAWEANNSQQTIGERYTGIRILVLQLVAVYLWASCLIPLSLSICSYSKGRIGMWKCPAHGRHTISICPIGPYYICLSVVLICITYFQEFIWTQGNATQRICGFWHKNTEKTVTVLHAINNVNF